jgi:GNAT superfamily N-acetyltransferase
MHTTDDILRAAAEWAWFPRGSERDDSELLLVRYPERLGGRVRASQVHSGADAAAVIEHAIDRTRAWGAAEITFWSNPSDSPDLEAELRRRRAEHIDTVAVFACPIEAVSIDVPQNASAELIRTLAQVREADAINVPVWEQDPLDEEGLRAELADVHEALASGAGIHVLGRLDGEAVSTGGCTIVDGFTRLWGAATLPRARGRGVYRAVLAERLRLGTEHGAKTALVKGRVSTSAPILARAGFHHFGDERAYRLKVSD